MPATPLRPVTANQNQPWSRSTPQRFGGYGSHHKPEVKPAGATPHKTPKREKLSTPVPRQAIMAPARPVPAAYNMSQKRASSGV